MNTALLRYVGKDQKTVAKFKAEWEAAFYLLDPLRKHLQQRLKELEITNKEDYEVANWAYYQADKEGSKRALREVLMLLGEAKHD